jgi:hypothetical protein
MSNTASNGPKPSPPIKAARPLVGRAFHSYGPDGDTRWQGVVEDDLGDGYFLLQLFEWLMGGTSQQIVVHISDMAHRASDGFSIKSRFAFYKTLEDMNDHYERVDRHQNDHIRRAKEQRAKED